MNTQQIIDAAEQIAVGMGTDPNQSTAIDSEMTAEDLLPLAFRHAYRELCQSGANSQDVMLTHTIELTDSTTRAGMQGPLPSGVLTEYLEKAFLPDFPFSSFMRYISDYDRERLDAMLCYWTVDDGVFYTTCAEGSSEEVGSGSEEVTITLRAPSVPVIPTLASTDIVIPIRARDHVIYILALALRGEIKLAV
jgi:hypothetical protein